MTRRLISRPHWRPGLWAVAWLVCAAGAAAQTPAPTNLRLAFDAAWARQPEAAALPLRRDAAQAQRDAADAWTPEPPALEAEAKGDRFNGNQGARELTLGVVVPLWLPGERSGSQALADAQAALLASQARAAQLRLALELREAWWRWQRSRSEVAIARTQLDATTQLAADVARRVKAGDLARADQHQAESARAAALASLAEADANLAAAAAPVQALVGAVPTDAGIDTEPTPADEAPAEAHALLTEWQDRAAVAERGLALARVQSRANPELTLTATRDRGALGEAYGQTLALGLRWAFGAGARHAAQVAGAGADAAEAQAQLDLTRARLQAERDAARVRVDAARIQRDAAQRRAELAGEVRGFYERAFNLGEADLPTRLRVQTEAAEAERLAARSRIDLAGAISAWRQALGLLPQ